uniref:DUF4283 domain-containing protein n=1 Tax=Solanum lycopersicum TaxID=4081 RepID=A0A3Q7EYH1_SOLLC
MIISVISVNGNDRSVIILPKNSFNEEWGELSLKIHNLISQKSSLQEANTEKGGLSSLGLRGEDSYKEILQKKKWCNGDQSQTSASSPGSDRGPLSRSLVGRFPNCDRIPTRAEVRNWAQQTWRGIHNLQIYDMNGTHFLFEFHSRRDAEHILLGDWRRRNYPLLLEWWKPTAGAFHADTIFDWFWVRILGLPLQLWNDQVMKQNDLCGGWLDMEEKTQLKNHLRWARLRVMGPREKITSSIEISDDNLIFTLPIWIEVPERYRKKEEDGLGDREVNKMKEKRKAIASPSLYQIATEERFRDKISNVYPGDIGKTTVPSTHGYCKARDFMRGGGPRRC